MDESAELTRRPDPRPAAVDRLDIMEQQVRQLTSRLAGWVEGQLVQALEDRRTDMKALRTELQTVVDEQLAGVRAETTSMLDVARRRLDLAQEQLGERLDTVAERVSRAAVSTNAQEQAARLATGVEELEQRVRAAMSRLTKSVESRLTESATTRQAEVDGLRTEIQETLARQSTELQADIRSVAQRASAVGEQVAAVVASVEALDETVGSDGRRLDALELHTRRTDARLTALVESKLAELAERRAAELDGMRVALQESLGAHGRRVEALEAHTRASDAHLADLVEGKLSELAGERSVELRELRDQLSSALDAHLTEVRAEVASALAAAREEIAVLDGQVAEARAEMASVKRKSDRAQEKTRRSLGALAEQVDALAAALAKAASTETGALAPVRSDLRLLQSEVAELAAVVGGLSPRRKAKAAAAAKATPRPGKAAPGAKAARAVPSTKGPEPVRRRPATQ